MYKKILLAADGSEHALRAAKEAAKIASFDKECTVEIVLVADFAQTRNEVLHSHGKEELEMSRRKKLLPMEELLKEHSLSYKITILHGEPAPAIVDYANQEQFDLVVIGSRGLNALQEMVLGSVSHKVVKRVNCPVLIVK